MRRISLALPASHHKPHKPPTILWGVMGRWWDKDGHEPPVHQPQPVRFIENFGLCIDSYPSLLVNKIRSTIMKEKPQKE